LPVKKWVLLLTLALCLGGCHSPGAGQAWMRSEVYFGLSKPDGSAVTAEQWKSFVSEVVTPRFPDGLSIVDTVGQWRNSKGEIEHEASKLLVLVHRRSREIERKIDEIRDDYRHRFNQEAVMKVATQVRVSF
jgi:hypothetical protein